MSAVLSGVKEVREVLRAAEERRRREGRRTVVFIDEIHRFNISAPAPAGDVGGGEGGAEPQGTAGPPPALGRPPSRLARGRGPTNPLRDGVFMATTFTGLLFTLIFCSHLSILPLTVTQSAGYPAVVFGLLAAVNGVLVAFFEISITARLKPFRRLRLAALGFFLAAVGFGMIGLVMHWAWFLLTVLVFTAGEILASPQQMSFIADWAPPEARGRYLSLYQATWSVAFAINPAITLPLHAALGERAFWGLMPIVALPGVLVLLRLDRTADKAERLRGLSAAA
jgi:MFS family permease